MILIYPKDGDYKIGQKFPFFTIPHDLKGAKPSELNAFQWWSTTSDFDKWLSENPRKWTAESEAPRSISNSPIDVRSVINENNQNKSGLNKVLKFDNYLNEIEATAANVKIDAGLQGEELAKANLKLYYAYNYLLSENKIEEELKISSLKKDDDKSIFISYFDSKTQKPLDKSIYALRAKPTFIGDTEKFVIIEVDEALPIGSTVNDDSESFFKKVSEATQQVLKYSAYGLVGWLGIKAMNSAIGELAIAEGGFWLLKKAWKYKLGFASRRGLEREVSPGIVKRIVSGTFRGVTELVGASLEGAGTILNVVPKLLGIGEAGEAAGFLGVGLEVGELSAGTLAAGITLIVYAAGAIQQGFNYWGKNQAPLYGDVESFAHDSFSSKDIPIGVPITICWTQKSGGVMGFLSAIKLFSSDTRTTMSIMKVASVEGKSIFIMLKVNSESMDKDLKSHDLMLLGFNDSDKFEHGFISNDDVKFQMLAIDGLSKIASVYAFMGVCDWSTILERYNKSSDQYIIADNKAPNDYNFYFSDSEDNIINVSGHKITSEEFSKYKDSDFKKIYEVKKVENKIGPDESDLKTESYSDSDILDLPFITEFEKYQTASVNPDYFINEAGNEEDDQGEGKIELTPKQKRGPAKLTVYLVDKKEYANPELQGKYSTGEFTNFTIPPECYNAKPDESIKVDANTSEILHKPKAGVYIYKEGESGDKDNDKKKRNDNNKGDASEQDEENKRKKKEGDDNEMVPGDDGNDIKADPNDVRIVNISNGPHQDQRTEITDHNVKDGINIFDKFLTQREKEALGIANWKSITFAQSQYDGKGDTVQVKLRNKYAGFGDRKRTYDVSDGEAFKIATKFIEEVKHRIKPY